MPIDDDIHYTNTSIHHHKASGYRHVDLYHSQEVSSLRTATSSPRGWAAA